MKPTPHDPPPVPADTELASAHLDGEVTDAERDQVVASAALSARVAELKAVRAALADVPAPGPGVRDAALAAALSTFDAADPGRRRLADVPAPTPLFGRRVASRILAAAAAVVVIAGIGLAVRSSSDDNDQGASTGLEDDRIFSAERGEPDAGAPAGAERPPEMVATSTNAPMTIPSIGGAADVSPIIATPEELASLESSTDGNGVPPAPTGGSNPDDLKAFNPECIEPGEAFVDNAVYQGTQVVVVDAESGGVRRARDAATCSILVEIDL